MPGPAEPHHITTASERIFRSAKHPGPASRSLVFGRALAAPLAWCMVPVMIVTLIAVLQGESVYGYLAAGFPAAILVAWWWTVYRLKSDVAEVAVWDGYGALRTYWDLLAARPGSGWLPVLDLRVGKTSLQAALGDAMHEFDRSDWPAFPEMTEALSEARQRNRETLTTYAA